MRALAIASAILIALAIPVIVFPKRGVGWVSGQEVVASFLSGPLLLLAIALCVYAISTRRKSGSVLLLLLALLLPLMLVGKSVILHSGKKLYWARKNEWLAIGDYVNPRLLQYFLQHPERFHRKPNSEEVEVDGFMDSLRSDPSFPQSGIRIRKSHILDPWGRPTSLLVDFNRDRDIYAENRGSGWIGTTEPVDAAVGMMLSRESERAIMGPEFINGRNGWKLTNP